MRTASDKVIEEIKSLFYVQLFLSEICAVYEIMWKNIVLPSRLQMTIRITRVDRWIPKASNTHSEYVIFNVFHCCNGTIARKILRYICIYIYIYIYIQGVPGGMCQTSGGYSLC